MRALRSLMIGDCDHYKSPYIHGVNQAMSLLGHTHSQISIRQPISTLELRIRDLKPDIIWTHMLLWGPMGSPPTEQLISAVYKAAKLGAKVVIHDGDYKESIRYPKDISTWCSVALCNHVYNRKAWKVPILHWPYFAFTQEKIADPVPTWKCELFFAGSSLGSGIYGAREQLLEDIRNRKIKIRTPTPAEGNTLFKTAEIAASADAVLGFGRPGKTGWTDTRVFQYSGAGGILIHDDAKEYLHPWMHYIPYQSQSADSVVDALYYLRRMPEREKRVIRESAFRFVQEKHSSVARVRQVLEFLYGKNS